MAVASGIRSRLVYVAEVTRGTTPGSPAMKVLRTNTRNINPAKESLESEEARSDRETQDYRHGFNSVEGDFVSELTLQSLDDMLEAALGGTWAAGTEVNTVAADADLGNFERATGSWLTDGYRPGDIVIAAGFTTGGNNSQFLVTAVTALLLTVTKVDGSAHGLTDEASDVSQTINLVGKRVQTGTTLASFTFERQALDLALYQAFRGVAINTLGISVKPRQIAMANFGLIGMGFDAETATPLDATPDAAPTTNPMNAFGGSIFEGGTVQTMVTGLDINLANNRALQDVVGNVESPDVFEGHIQVSGSLTLLHTSIAAYNKFKNETETSIWCRLRDPDTSTSFLQLVMNRVKLMGNQRNPPRSGPVIQTIPFRALPHSTYGTTSLSIQRSNA